jgi:hypothetical protein
LCMSQRSFRHCLFSHCTLVYWPLFYWFCVHHVCCVSRRRHVSRRCRRPPALPSLIPHHVCEFFLRCGCYGREENTSVLFASRVMTFTRWKKIQRHPDSLVTKITETTFSSSSLVPDYSRERDAWWKWDQ